jgi:hypothetical protein
VTLETRAVGQVTHQLEVLLELQLLGADLGGRRQLLWTGRPGRASATLPSRPGRRPATSAAEGSATHILVLLGLEPGRVHLEEVLLLQLLDEGLIADVAHKLRVQSGHQAAQSARY